MPWRARSTPNWLASAALRRVLTALPRDLIRTITAGPGSPPQAGAPQWTTPPAWVTGGALRARSISSPSGQGLLEDRDYRGAARDAAGIRGAAPHVVRENPRSLRHRGHDDHLRPRVAGGEAKSAGNAG